MDEEELWAERAARFHIAFKSSLDSLREGLPLPVLSRLYAEEWQEWKEVMATVPGMTFTPGNRQAQEDFYKNLDAICVTLDLVKKDAWKSCVPLTIKGVSVLT